MAQALDGGLSAKSLVFTALTFVGMLVASEKGLAVRARNASEGVAICVNGGWHLVIDGYIDEIASAVNCDDEFYTLLDISDGRIRIPRTFLG